MRSGLRAGKVVSFDAANGLGLIAPYGGDEHVPFHAQAIRFVDRVTEGQPVIYATEGAVAAVRAVEVRPA
ncbi:MULTISPECIES: cold-shock protein [unclassified Streptomyces]|uniref:cold-shock protein n=1 Tax=unclassified Streptomyces TaxID=2593676 RepID=UPI003317BA7F